MRVYSLYLKTSALDSCGCALLGKWDTMSPKSRIPRIPRQINTVGPRGIQTDLFPDPSPTILFLVFCLRNEKRCSLLEHCPSQQTAWPYRLCEKNHCPIQWNQRRLEGLAGFRPLWSLVQRFPPVRIPLGSCGCDPTQNKGRKKTKCKKGRSLFL